jgi:hypothetical protein
MRQILLILALLFTVSLSACGGDVDDLNANDATPVIRTDFSDEAAWKQIKRDVAAKNRLGFSANIQFIDDQQNDGLTGQEVLRSIPGLDSYGCVFVVDAAAMSSEEHHLLVLDPFNPEGQTFRVIPAEAWGVENNLAIANMDYSEFAAAADADGVFRGFK